MNNLWSTGAEAFQVSVHYDSFQKMTVMEGPEAEGKDDSITVDSLAAPRYVSDYAKSYSYAYDENGTKLTTRHVDLSVPSCSRIGCRYREEVAIVVTREYLDRLVQSRARIKVYGKHDNLIFVYEGSAIAVTLKEFDTRFPEVARLKK
jgi:hypothetical protein